MQYSHDRRGQNDVPGIDSQIREFRAKTGKNGKDCRKKVSNIRGKVTSQAMQPRAMLLVDHVAG
jgi:hypothetical protein